ncbi:MAG TPA: hypothetical protein VIM16_07610 [Mucilaginibacter sp.]|jgi:hypothetical protein
MNPTIQLIFEIVGGALTLLTVYGALKSDRKFFLSGLCYFSILPVIGSAMAYSDDKAPVHILVIFLFLVQFVLALPIKINFGPDNLAAIKLATKIGFAFLIINVAGAVFILCLKAPVPALVGYYHVVFSLAVVYIIIKRFSSKGISWIN